jgi:DNA-binding transcriptional regulator YiaG
VSAKKTTFQNFIKQFGQDRLARQLSVSPSTVGHWLSGHCKPTDEKKKQIVKLAKGAVTYECIIDGGS